RWSPSTSVVDGKIYVVGGSETIFPSHPGISRVDEYDTGFVPDSTTNVNPLGKLPMLWGEIKCNQ
ncbi:MAG: hypothetical protein ACXADF_18680, partial [Candidatus Thorarchaeota archaeon]